MRLVAVIIFLSLSLSAQIIEAEYRVGYGLFGKVGNSKAFFEKKDRIYRIRVVAKATGFAKVLSGGRVEIYESRGKVIDGILVPLVYKKEKITSNKYESKLYKFDHENRKIYLRTIYIKNGKTDKDVKEVLKYYAKEDVLSLYFNLKKYFEKEKKEHYTFFAVGGNRKDGRVDVEIPKGKKLQKLRRLMGNIEGKYLTVTLNQKIFASKKGELFIVMDSDGITKKALLKDVVLFGDITGKLVRKRVVGE
ncbi:DUF3108 domain-containing protein [Nitrosophilus alvini]|uniref:DUF3108 domain-containing protein n=1 Tax=Nitrosophilus alvini TaxID=2714855 RepID=UPI00190DAF01|nr:DUF3108 domain-containing protein [Nitrosophilus alvini]